MGVKSCSRLGCENIMCDTYIYNIGYICYDCQSEFINSKGLYYRDEQQLLKKLDKFMNNEKAYSKANYEFDAKTYFNDNT